MKNQILDEIKDFAKSKLTEAYGFCGVADGDDIVMINSTDSEGNDIIINIKVKKDE